jgi:carbonic anhydrase
MITQSGPGDLFELRNAGNMIPPYGASNGGEAAAVEFAVVGLGVKDIIICGHTCCGAIGGLLDPTTVEKMPLMRTWLEHAETTRRIMEENYPDVPDTARRNIAVQEHALLQIENLQTHPCVAVRLQRRELTLHAWVYKLETGEVFAYSPEAGRYLPLAAELVPVARQT